LHELDRIRRKVPTRILQILRHRGNIGQQMTIKETSEKLKGMFHDNPLLS